MKKSALFKLTVLHTNDIHGNIYSLPQYSTVVNEIRRKEKISFFWTAAIYS